MLLLKSGCDATKNTGIDLIAAENKKNLIGEEEFFEKKWARVKINIGLAISDP